MADENTEQTELKDDAELAKARAAAFDEGFSESDDASRAAAEGTPAGEGDGEADAGNGEQPKQEETVKAAEPPADGKDAGDKPEYVQLTKEQMARYEAAAERVAKLETSVSTLGGTLGNMKQVIDQFRTGAEVELTDDMFADMKEQFGDDLVGVTKKAMASALKKVRVAPSQSITDEHVQTLVKDALQTSKMDDLNQSYPDWQTIVGVPEKKGEPLKDTDYQKWLAGESKAYQELLRTTTDPAVMRRSIARFNSRPAPVKADPPPKPKQPSENANVRRERMAQATTPRGDGGAPTVRQKTAQDYFNEGYEEG